MPVSLRFLAFCSLAIVALPGSFAKDRFDKWAEQEVGWIISQAEKEELKALSTPQEKEAFVERFWALRDPAPDTPRNEYKEEYYRRLQFVKERFREGIPGWKTDRGRVYLLHGPPDQIESFNREGGNAYGVAHGAAHLVWKYSQLEAPGPLAGAVVFVFRPDQGTSAIAGPTSQGSLDPRSARPIFTRSGTKVDVPVNAAVRYRLVAAGPPSVVAGNEVRLSPEAALQVESLLRNPGERVMARVRELERQEASRSELRQQIDSTITFGTLPVDMTLHEFYSPEELSLNLAWHWPQDQLQFESYQGGRLAKTDLMVQVLDAEGRTVDELFKSFTLEYRDREFEKAVQDGFEYFNVFHLPRGRDYRIRTVVKDAGSGKLGSAVQEYSASGEKEEGHIHLSGLVLARQVVPRETPGLGADLVVDEFGVVPTADRVFPQAGRIVLYCKVYQAAPGPEGPRVSVDYRFLREGELEASGRPRLLAAYSAPETREIQFSAVIELEQFATGDYQLQLTAVDLNSKKYAIARTPLSIR